MIVDPISPIGKSPIGWMGGKTKLRPTILTCFPPHFAYVEIFAGSATVLFGKPRPPVKSRKPEDARIEVINDIHTELIVLMKVLGGVIFDGEREKCQYCNHHLDSEEVRQEFIQYVRDFPASRAAYEEWKNWDTEEKVKHLNYAQRAFRFYYCVKKGFSSIPKGGYEASPLTNSRYNQNTDFEPFKKRLRNVSIEQSDFVDLIEKYNRDRAKTFFFGDPPYWVATGSYYDHPFTLKQHKDLKKCCDEIDKNENLFLLTYDDVPEVLEMYKDYCLYRTDPIVYSSSDEREKRKLIKTEIFVTNYDLANMIHERNATGRRRDMFAEIEAGDKRIDIPGHIGLERIN